MLYAGCAVKTADSMYYVFADGAFCLTRLSGLASTLAVVGCPRLAAVCFVAAILCLVLGVKLVAPDGLFSLERIQPRQSGPTTAGRRIRGERNPAKQPARVVG